MKKRQLEYALMPEIEERYSTMHFGEGEVSEEDLRAMLLAATQAPSAYNEQPWRFYVAKTPQDKEMLLKLAIPEGFKPLAALALGYGEEEIAVRKEFTAKLPMNRV